MSRSTRILAAVASAALVILFTILVAWGFTLLPSPTPESPPEAPRVTLATVDFVADGDTAQFRLESGAEERVRFIGIDTPELGEPAEPYSRESSAYTRAAIPAGTTVWLETDAELRDKHGRLLAYVWLEQPVSGDDAEVREKMLNARIVLDGFARTFTYPPNVRYADVFADLEAEAQDAGRGLWAE